MFIAELDTRNFTFTALGTNAVTAKTALRKGWERHCKDRDVDPKNYDIEEDGNCFEIFPNTCCRDHERI